MPRGIYKRTEKHLKILRKTIKITHKLPKSEAQLKISHKNAYMMSKLPRTQKQIDASRRMGLDNRGKSCKGNVFADDIVEHHNDLVHGAERPDDVTYMVHRDHSRFHAKLRIEDGTHHFLAKNRNG